MISLKMQIEMLEDAANDAELLSSLACEPEARLSNRLLAKRLREDAETLRHQIQAIAA
jgi:aminopeptidase C